MSKTVKRVSKTVKRVMRVMMVGLVAMLATKAQAHSRYIKPIGVWYCPPSVCVGMHTEEEEPMDSSHIEIGEVVLDEIIAEGPCKKGDEVSVPRLVVRKQTDSITHLIDEKDVRISIGTLVAIFADSVVSKYSHCSSDGSIPDFVLFRQFSVLFTPMIEKVAGACARGEDKDTCSAIGETVKVSICKLKEKYNLDNLPTPNVFFKCVEQ